MMGSSSLYPHAHANMNTQSSHSQHSSKCVCEASCRCVERKKPTRRELVVHKSEDEEFGAVLFLIDGRVYIGWVPDQEGSWVHSAAYRCGLDFGDQIMNINGHEVTGLGPCEVQELLDNGTKTTLEVSDAPLIRTLSFPCAKGKPKKEPLGFVYFKSQARFVQSGSFAERGGMEVGDCVIDVDGVSVFGMPDHEVVETIRQARLKVDGDDVVLRVMPACKAEKFLICFREILRRRGQSHLQPYQVLSPRTQTIGGWLGDRCCC
eukprot:comp8635_c0_seq1/m.3926 comp8635_c0_seq1/g.3926  ORF comp8635_c0_seq1/g.3926 comp8635_c0_seq1/m.3926 type:complete len:263 (-) comp8635_c0_seq1:752-1540(-)